VVTSVRGPKRDWLAGGMLRLGPKISLLAPISACSLLLCRWRVPECISSVAARLMVIVSTALIIVLHAVGYFDTDSKLRETMGRERWYPELGFSESVLCDHQLMVLVFCNFAGVCVGAPPFSVISAPVKWLAGYTFTLYLLHRPLFMFWGAVWHGDPCTSKAWWMVTALTTLSVVALGQLTEHRREAFRRALQRLFTRIEARRSAPGQHA